ncbi:hypothetical protein KYK30_31720 [Shinella yambaruensis]|uniref:Lysozyme n=1 Tax=Shinella yambaruensis TaxID=415996 RepID=A0ABQ5ZT63_9HYPH|nr:hypothetical protein [Shinella yambaruensis]MCJ8030002.1 hypothetical protein [Shinella yambaruensis]MCU7984294.1 hypothetical protein [Shinella yambaruensis]GLR55122.1 hypothetical protein GCM10007923_63430 [Shinella yambaruensis]
MDKYHVYRPMLDLIGFTEGTDKGDGYNETLAYGAFTDGNVNLVSMTLKDLDALQTKMLQHPKNKLRSSACGRYQIVRTTARDIRERLPGRYPLSRRFDAACQDEMACYLLGVRGIDKYLAGRLSEDALIDNLAREWASLPTVGGKGFYDGQHAAVRTARVRDVLAEVRRRHKAGQPVERVEVPVPVDKPVVPETVEQKVKEKSNRWTWLTGGGGLGTIGLGWLSGMDWRAIAAGGVVLVVVLLVLILLRSQIIAAVRQIRAEVGS